MNLTTLQLDTLRFIKSKNNTGAGCIKGVSLRAARELVKFGAAEEISPTAFRITAKGEDILRRNMPHDPVETPRTHAKQFDTWLTSWARREHWKIDGNVLSARIFGQRVRIILNQKTVDLEVLMGRKYELKASTTRKRLFEIYKHKINCVKQSDGTYAPGAFNLWSLCPANIGLEAIYERAAELVKKTHPLNGSYGAHNFFRLTAFVARTHGTVRAGESIEPWMKRMTEKYPTFSQHSFSQAAHKLAQKPLPAH